MNSVVMVLGVEQRDSAIHMLLSILPQGLPRWLSSKICLPMQEIWVSSLRWEDPLEKGMATHSSTLAWISPWT